MHGHAIAAQVKTGGYKHALTPRPCVAQAKTLGSPRELPRTRQSEMRNVYW